MSQLGTSRVRTRRRAAWIGGTLLAIATARPRFRRDLEGLPGLGAAKLERYGDALLSFLAE